jgi:sugar phosphate isomerase/epimerase
VRIGVSPAFYLSAYTTGFSTADLAAALPRIARLGFDAVQLEVYAAEALGEWSPARRVEIASILEGEGLVASQFVAHFALEDLRSAASLSAPRLAGDFAAFVEIAAAFPACDFLTLPVPAFDPAGAGDPGGYHRARAGLAGLLRRYVALAADAGKRLALELMPRSLVGGLAGLLALRREEGLGNLGCNLDTGHAWASGELVELAPAVLGDALVGLHLCDDGGEGRRKGRPGTGAIDFPAFFDSLAAAGYRGSCDVEILCGAAEVEAEYSLARAFVREQLERASRAPAPA